MLSMEIGQPSESPTYSRAKENLPIDTESTVAVVMNRPTFLPFASEAKEKEKGSGVFSYLTERPPAFQEHARLAQILT
jgi:hypothetical protein